jgi:transcriptional regulator with XRE-family HTH domain
VNDVIGGHDADKTEQQRAVYGEPLRDLVRRITDGLGLSQAAIARTLGLSPPMLSQLITGQRVKIGNPLVVSRLQSLLTLAAEAPTLTQRDITVRLDDIRAAEATALTATAAPIPPSRQAEVIRHMLRAVASGQEISAAVAALRQVAPGLAEAIWIYATGSPDEAERHAQSIAAVSG